MTRARKEDGAGQLIADLLTWRAVTFQSHWFALLRHQFVFGRLHKLRRPRPVFPFAASGLQGWFRNTRELAQRWGRFRRLMLAQYLVNEVLTERRLDNMPLLPDVIQSRKEREANNRSNNRGKAKATGALCLGSATSQRNERGGDGPSDGQPAAQPSATREREERRNNAKIRRRFSTGWPTPRETPPAPPLERRDSRPLAPGGHGGRGGWGDFLTGGVARSSALFRRRSLFVPVIGPAAS